VVGGGGASYLAVLDDGNTVAWFDYLKNVTKDGSDLVSVWGDKSVDSLGALNGNDLLQATGSNQPIVNANGILFDGIDNFMKCAAFTLVQPEFIYMVVNQVSWANFDYIFDGNTTNSGNLYQTGVSPEIAAVAGISSGRNDNLIIGIYGIVRILFDGVNSKLIVNNTSPISGDFGLRNMGGFYLGAISPAIGFFANIEVKEIIIRKVADNATDEQAIYEYLAEKYSIT